MVISDLAYADVTFDGYKTPSFLAAPGAIDVGVELTTMSKGYNMAGWRVGFAAGNAEMLRACRRSRATTTTACFGPSRSPRSWPCGTPTRPSKAQAAIYQRRRDVLCEGLERIGWPVERPKASMFVWAKIPEPWASQMTSFEFAMKLLEEGDVVVSPARVRPGRRRISAHGLGGKRKPLAPGSAPNRPLSGKIADFCRAVRNFVARAFSR